MADPYTEYSKPVPTYRGRLAPSPTGYLHLGHARTFWTAQQRARERNGVLILRNENIDHERCKPRFVEALIEDLRWFGFRWQEGPDCGGPHEPYTQSERYDLYHDALEKLREQGLVYPCVCSRKDILQALSAPHAGDDEPIYPGTCRPQGGSAKTVLSRTPIQVFNWRFKVPDGVEIAFIDGHFGLQKFVAGRDFGDFIVWRHDDVPAYQLAITVDDAAMGVTEVVRGADLLKSTARQLLLYRALGLRPPSFFHCPLLTDEEGIRLAKRHQSMSLRELRNQGHHPETLRQSWQADVGQMHLSSSEPSKNIRNKRIDD